MWCSDGGSFVAGLLLPTRIGEGVCGVWSGALFPILQVDFFLPASESGCLWRGEWCPLPLFAGRFFSTRIMGQVAVFGVERVCDFCMRVLFLIPVQLRGACVQCGVGLRGKHSFVAGLLFSTRIGEGVCGVGSGALFPILQVDFFLPVSCEAYYNLCQSLPLLCGYYF